MHETSLYRRYHEAHQPGKDCRITSARNLLEMYGHRHSYAIVQGLAGSFFFTYRRAFSALDRLTFPDLDVTKYYWPVSGQRMEVLENLAYQFNALLVMRSGQTSEEAERDLLEYLRQDVPVMVAVSRESLARHFGKPYGYPPFLRNLHFGGHFITVVAAEERRRVVAAFDTDHTEVLEVPFGVLAEARVDGGNKATCFMQSQNRWAVLIPGTSVPRLEQMCGSALVRIIHMFRSAEDDTQHIGGFRALNRFCDEVLSWNELTARDPDLLRATVYMLRMNSDLISGGSVGRRHFGMFVRRAAELLRSRNLLAAAIAYAELTKLWNDLLDHIERSVLGQRTIQSLDVPAVRETLLSIRDREQSAMSRIERAMG